MLDHHRSFSLVQARVPISVHHHDPDAHVLFAEPWTPWMVFEPDPAEGSRHWLTLQFGKTVHVGETAIHCTIVVDNGVNCFASEIRFEDQHRRTDGLGTVRLAIDTVDALVAEAVAKYGLDRELPYEEYDPELERLRWEYNLVS